MHVQLGKVCFFRVMLFVYFLLYEFNNATFSLLSLSLPPASVSKELKVSNA